MDPPSISGGYPPMPIRPPHVRVPTRVPAPRRRNIHGKASPPEPAYSLISITFGPKIDAGKRNVFTFTGHRSGQDGTLQPVDDVIGNPAAAVEAFIDNRALFVALGKVIAVEVCVPINPSVRQVNISELATAELIDLAPVVFHPGALAKRVLI